MRLTLLLFVAIALTALHLIAFWAVLHPKVSREYKAYYIDRTSRDWRVKKYHADPEDGIDFTKDGWPDFVDYSFGIMRDPSVGAWTDTRFGLKAGFEFTHPFSGHVCVVVDAAPSDAAMKHPVPLAFGDRQKQITFAGDETVRPYAVDFDLPHPANRLEFVFPKPFRRVGPGDARQIGVELTRIRILPQSCAVKPGSRNERGAAGENGDKLAN